jgi:type IX secretion system PorP/SprF family membrane protein
MKKRNTIQGAKQVAMVLCRGQKITCLLLLLCICAWGKAQDFHLSQFFNTPLLRNPALAGIFTGDVRVQSVYRNQWQSIGFPYQTHVLGGEYKFQVGRGDDYMTVGGVAVYDQAGIMKLKTLQVMPVINFHKSLSGLRNAYLSGGFSAGVVSRNFDGQNLTFDNQYTGGRFVPGSATGERFTGLSRSFFDISTGLSFNTDLTENSIIYIGASLWHFHKPQVNFFSTQLQLNPKWQFNAGIRSNLSPDLVLTAEANYLQQGPYNETIGGLGLMYRIPNSMPYGTDNELAALAVGFGAYMRLGDAIIPYLQISYKHLDIGLSYDVNVSRLKVASQGRGGFELSLSYRGFVQQSSAAIRSVLCPRF